MSFGGVYEVVTMRLLAGIFEYSDNIVILQVNVKMGFFRYFPPTESSHRH